MNRYMIRKPEFLQGAEAAKYFPNTAAVIGIVLLIFLACMVGGVILVLLYTTSAGSQYMRGELDLSTAVHWTLLFALFAEALLILFTVIHVRSIEKRPLRTIGFVKKIYGLKYLIGFVIGALLLGVNMLPPFLSLPFEFTGVKPIAIVFLIAFILQSAGEEVLFRGYMMSALLRRGSGLWALVISTVVFGLIHIFNGYNFLTMCLVTLLGAVLGAYMLREGSIWGAMGLHAAWNFFTTCLVSVPIGPYRIDFAFFTITVPESENAFMITLQFLVLIAALAMLLFAGENRLVVRKTERQILFDKALRLVKETVSDRGQLSYAMRISELAEGNEGKITALLYHAMGYGASAGYIEHVFGEELFSAAKALTVCYGEGAMDYWRRIMKYSAAVSVKYAEIKLEQIKRPNTGNPYASPYSQFVGQRVQCPMMCWSVTQDMCLHLSNIADGEAPAEGEEYTSALNFDVCRGCSERRARSHRTFWGSNTESPKNISFLGQ